MNTELKILHISLGVIFLPVIFLLSSPQNLNNGIHYVSYLLGFGCITGGCVLKYVQVRQSVRIKVSNLQSVPIV